MSLLERGRAFFNKGHVRTVRTKKNVFWALVFKAISVLIGFAFFPLSLSYLGATKFAIFLTLVSVIDWFSELDIGVGAGLRNKLGESIAREEYDAARRYVSTAYVIQASIFGGVFLLFSIASFFLPWSAWLQTVPELENEIALLAVLMFAALAIRFVASLIYEVFYAFQKTALVNFYNMLSKVLFLFVLLALYFGFEASLLLFGIVKTMTFALIPVMVGGYYFRANYSAFKPAFRWAEWRSFKVLFGLGLQFFAIKISMLLIHKTNNFLIAAYVRLEEVALYEAAFKYMSIFLIFFLILTNQLWAANIEAYQQRDFVWMQNNLKNVIYIWLGTVGLSVVMVWLSPPFFRLWLGTQLQIPIELTLIVAVSILLTTWVNLFNLVLNGTGKIRVQMLLWLAASVLNIPLSIYFAQTLQFGTIGIVLGTIVCLLPLAVIAPIQVWKILRQRDTGIWGL